MENNGTKQKGHILKPHVIETCDTNLPVGKLITCASAYRLVRTFRGLEIRKEAGDIDWQKDPGSGGGSGDQRDLWS